MTRDRITKAEKLINCLKNNNYYEYYSRKQDLQKKLEGLIPETLFKYAIVVEKNFNFSKTTFIYRQERGVLVRIKFMGHLDNENASYYKRQHNECLKCKNPCYRRKYTIDDFIDLVVKGVFELVEVYSVK